MPLPSSLHSILPDDIVYGCLPLYHTAGNNLGVGCALIKVSLESKFPPFHGTMVQNSQESRCKQWATRSSVSLFARTAHSFTHSAQLASLTHSAALIGSLTHYRACGKVNYYSTLVAGTEAVLNHSALPSSTRPNEVTSSSLAFF